MAFTNQEVRAYIDSIYASGGTNADVAAAMDQFNVPASQVAAAFSDVPGISAQAVQSAYDASRPGGMMASPVGPVSPAGLAPAPSPISLTPAASTMMPAAPAPAAPLPSRDERYQTIRNELETQYNNVVSAGQQQGKDLSYRGKKSDLPTIFNQQAAQLADAGVSSISNLRLGEISEPIVSDGRETGTRTYQGLIDITTGNPVKAANLNGEVARDRDTGAQKWGDILSGVKGGANYGIEFAPDGSPILFPVHEKTKSPIAQLGLGGLEDIIGPVLTIAGAYYGMPGLGKVAGAAAGAAAGNTVGQYLASGDVDWAQVATSAALAGGSSYLSGVTNTPTANAALLADDAAFVAENASLLAETGISPSQITQTLIGEGINPDIARLASNLAVAGTDSTSIANTLSGMGGGISGGLFSATPADLATAGITTGGTGVPLSADQLKYLASTATPGVTLAEQMAGLGDPFAGLTTAAGQEAIAGTATGGGLLQGIADKASLNTLAEQAKGLLSGTNLTKLLGAGVDYAALQQIGKEATSLGREAEARATAAGAAANVPFTPYTVTSGAGSTAFGTGVAGQPTATVTSSPEYQALRTQALTQAGTTLGAINPATAAESLFQRSEALAGPARQRETEQLLSSLGARGLLGMSQNLPTVGGTTAGVNPYLESLLSAQRTAQANTALQAQRFGTQEATSQAALAQNLISTGQGIDTAAMGTLTQGQSLGRDLANIEQTNAQRLLDATLKGQGIRLGYENIGLQSRAQGISGLAGVGRGLLGLPTQPGNTASQNILGNIFDEIFK